MTCARLLALVGALLAAVDASAAAAGERTLVDFEMEDQFRNLHTRAELLGDVVVLIGGDREGRTHNAAWRATLQDAMQSHPRRDHVSYVSHADLRAVPRAARGMARRVAANNASRPILMDWTGELARAYDYAPGRSNLLVFAPDGALALQTDVGAPDTETLERLTTLVRELLDRES